MSAGLRPTTAGGAFPPAVTVALAALGVPRVVLHDLGALDGAPLANLVLVLGPLAIWIGVALASRISRPLWALTWVGATYGVLLAATHQLLWDRAFADDPPRLGGNLEGRLPAAVEELVLRSFAVGSGVVTGLLVGVVSGAVALALRRTRP